VKLEKRLVVLEAAVYGGKKKIIIDIIDEPHLVVQNRLSLF
jgi:hypothetical protein